MHDDIEDAPPKLQVEEICSNMNLPKSEFTNERHSINPIYLELALDKSLQRMNI
jgi:hypothetical protein